ncbi:MAG: hypothetical protein Q9180_000434 [Flavoplaca navasiana]
MGPGLQNPRPTSAPASGSGRPFTPTSAPIAGGTIDFPGLASLYDGTWQTPLHAANSSPPTSPWPWRMEPYLQGNSAAASNGSLPDHQSTWVDRSGLQQATAPEERRPALPQYEPRMSKTVPGQPRALDWLTEEGKVRFTEVEDAIHSQWGRSNHYRSTCLLLCEDWRHSDPLDLMALFSPDNMPPVGSPRAKYSYKDHGVAFTRAKVWFESVNRTAGNLDVYLNTGPFKPMDASHLCHQEHCIIHVVYEPAHINHDRSQCCSRAKFLRSEGKDVPELCSIHVPPCLMQNAATTALEIHYQQFTVLSMANDLPLPVPPTKPFRYPYPTFEGRLPCRFPSLIVGPADLVNKPTSEKITQRPTLRCDFCTQDVLRNFATIHGFWCHIVNKHQGVENDVRLAVVRESASRWRRYWEIYSGGGKRANSTSLKLEQTTHEGFCWSDVLAWSLRWG